MYCQECGKLIVDGSRFCEHCGAPQPVSEDFGPQQENTWQEDNTYQQRDTWQEDNTYQQDNAWQEDNIYQQDNAWQEDNTYQQDNAWQENNTYQQDNAWQGDNTYQQDNDYQQDNIYQQDNSRQQNGTGQQMNRSKQSRQGGQQKPQKRTSTSQKRSSQKAQPKELTPEEKEKRQKIKKRSLLIAGIAAAAIVVLIVLRIVITPSINLNDYMTLSASGYDTVGKAEVTFDIDSFAEDYGSKLTSSNSSALSTASASSQYSAANSFLSYCVDYEVDVESGLSNGDTITLTWSCDDEYAEETYGYKLKYEEITYTVSGLEEAETFNPFDGVEVVFEGISPYGTAYVDTSNMSVTEEAIESLGFTLDADSNLANGDTVTISVVSAYSDDAIEYCAETYGVIPSPAEMTYTVSGLSSYLEDLGDISEESLDELKSDVADYYAEDAEGWDEDTEVLQEMEYVGAYLLTLDDTDSWSDKNMLYLVYKVTVKNTYSDDDDKYSATNTFYWYAKYYEVIIDEEGALELEEEYYDQPGDYVEIDSGIDYWWGTYGWSYRGYESISALYEGEIEGQLDYYEVQDLVDAESGETMEFTSDSEDEEEGIIFPNSSEELLTQSDIEDLTDEELRYAINEIYARNGYIFKDEELLEYYSKYDWYEQEVEADDFTLSMLNDIEQDNIDLLSEERDSRS